LCACESRSLDVLNLMLDWAVAFQRRTVEIENRIGMVPTPITQGEPK
jgi:hypothetical protein